MDVFEAIKSRRSIRAFTSQKVTDKQIEKLIDAARWAPSAGNIQPWEFVIVKNAEIKRKLAEAALSEILIEEAPVVIVVCVNENRSSEGYGIRGKTLYCIQDTAAATQNMLLAAHALGLSTCWIGAFHEEDAKQALKTPAGIRPVAIIPIGYPAEKPSAPHRKPLSEIVHYEAF